MAAVFSPSGSVSRTATCLVSPFKHEGFSMLMQSMRKQSIHLSFVGMKVPSEELWKSNPQIFCGGVYEVGTTEGPITKENINTQFAGIFLGTIDGRTYSKHYCRWSFRGPCQEEIFPALFALYYEDRLPQDFQIFGYSRTPTTDEELRNNISAMLHAD